MAVADRWRQMNNYTEAVNIYSMLPTDQARIELAHTYMRMGKVTTALQMARQMAKDADFPLRDDALLIEAQCREAQGFDNASRRILRKLVKGGNPEAAFLRAQKLFAAGHTLKAEDMCIKSIRADATYAPAHKLMAAIEANQGRRYRAMLPLYYYLLVSTDDEGKRQAYEQLVRLWRHSANMIDVLHRGKTADAFNDGLDAFIRTVATSDSISTLQPQESVALLARYTDTLFRHILATSEENLDFWQVFYADFFAKLPPRGFVVPFVYFIADAAHHPEVLAWISENAAFFDEFRLWMGAQ